ncbi:MAG: response regulator [Bacteroidota bacterium]
MSNLKILVVEDEMLVAADIQESLEILGYTVQNTVATGQAAIDQVEKDLPDVILMDIMLKGDMTGVEAANLIRKKHDVPIIYLTANADIGTIEKAKISLPYGYIIKPFTEKDLQTNIEIARFKFENDLKSKMESDQFNRFFTAGEKKHIIVQGESGGLEKLNPDDIYYIEASGNQSVVHLPEDELVIDRPIDEAQKLFPADKFIRVNNDHIVNMDKIFLAKYPEIIIAEKMTVIIVDEDKKELLEEKTGTE